MTPITLLLTLKLFGLMEDEKTRDAEKLFHLIELAEECTTREEAQIDTVFSLKSSR